MKDFPPEERFHSEFRAKLYSSQVESGFSLPQLSDKMGLQPNSLLSDYFKGKEEMPVSVLYRYGQLVGRPIWWFFGEQPSGITIEAAQNALTNAGRVRLYLDAMESEFKQVIEANMNPESSLEHISAEPGGPSTKAPVVVDFAPFLARARAILEAEAECTEDSEEVFEESVELIAHRLYSIEMAAAPSREMAPSGAK